MKQNIAVSNIAIQNTGKTNLLLLSCIAMFPFNIHYELYLLLHTSHQHKEVVTNKAQSLRGGT